MLLSVGALATAQCPTRASVRASISGQTVLPYTSSQTDTWLMLRSADADPAAPANVILIYSNVSVDGAQEYNYGSGWTREHIWPQSLAGMEANANQAPATDGHALVAALGSCNSKRNNNRFGVLNLLADSTCHLACDGVAGVCEPADRVKGQVARALLYMASEWIRIRTQAAPDRETT